MIEICAVNCTEWLSKSQFTKLLSFVDKDKQTRINRFVKNEDAQRTLIADILARQMICNKINLPPHKIEFSYNDYGKPYLKANSTVHFNVTHSENWVVCAIDDKPLGIDIEHVKPIDSHIAENFFSDEENRALDFTDDDKKLEYFYDTWTLKESYVKALGKGLSIPLNSFVILKYDGFIILKSGLDKNKYYFRQYAIDRNYILSVCGINSTFSDIQIYNCSQIYNLYIDVVSTPSKRSTP